MASNREKSHIVITILEKLPFLKGNTNYSHFDGSNNIFADCKILPENYHFPLTHILFHICKSTASKIEKNQLIPFLYTLAGITKNKP